MSKKCPKCNLWNSDSAIRCDCGYDFNTNRIEGSYNQQLFPLEICDSLIVFIIYSFIINFITFSDSEKTINILIILLQIFLGIFILAYYVLRNFLIRSIGNKTLGIIVLSFYSINLLIENLLLIGKSEYIIFRFLIIFLLLTMYIFLINRKEFARIILIIIGFPFTFLFLSKPNVKLYCHQFEIRE
jgi:hypothetical protein